MRSRVLVLVGVAAAAVILSGCSASEPSIAGVWVAEDGTTKTIQEDGQCSGMYYSNGQQLDIGGGMVCTLSEGTGGDRLLVVQQPPNEVTYSVSLEGDNTMTISNSGTTIQLERQ